MGDGCALWFLFSFILPAPFLPPFSLTSSIPLLIFHAQLDMGPARPTKLHSVPVKIEKDGPANVDKLVTSVI